MQLSEVVAVDRCLNYILRHGPYAGLLMLTATRQARCRLIKRR